MTAGSLLLTPTSLTGRIAGAVTTSAPGVRFDGAFASDVDSDAGAVTTTGHGGSLTVGDMTFTGIDLTLVGARDAAGPVLWITGGAGATATFGGPGGLLTTTLTGALQLIITADGASLDGPVTLAPAAAGVVAPSGPFELRLAGTGPARLEEARPPRWPPPPGTSPGP